MTSKADKQVLRSRAFRALAQDDRPRRAFEQEGRVDDEYPLSLFPSRDASPHVILSAEGAKDLLLMTDNR
jgi:hypothetical protein